MIPQPGTLPAKARREATAARFAVAREATTLVFRAILRADLLPRLLDPAVLAHYANPSPDLLDRPETGEIPLEFSHGAFRFGHAMLRDTYRIGDFTDATLADLLRLTSARSPNAVPLSRRWIIRWSNSSRCPGIRRRMPACGSARSRARCCWPTGCSTRSRRATPSASPTATC